MLAASSSRVINVASSTGISSVIFIQSSSGLRCLTHQFNCLTENANHDPGRVTKSDGVTGFHFASSVCHPQWATENFICRKKKSFYVVVFSREMSWECRGFLSWFPVSDFGKLHQWYTRHR
jgi:hypothetical protein